MDPRNRPRPYETLQQFIDRTICHASELPPRFEHLSKHGFFEPSYVRSPLGGLLRAFLIRDIVTGRASFGPNLPDDPEKK